MYGKISSSWKLYEGDGEIELHFTIPANTSATVTLPTITQGEDNTEEKGKPEREGLPTKTVKLGSGTYSYRYRY